MRIPPVLILLFSHVIFTSSSQCTQRPFLPGLAHSESHLDASLQRLAVKNLTVEDILGASGIARKCPKSSTLSTARSARLIYVTPWNTDGYSYTTLHSERISLVVPVWYQVKVHSATVTLDGRQNINREWLTSLHPSTSVLPRFEVQFASTKEIEAILFFPRGEADGIVSAIVNEVKLSDYAGATLEVPYTAQMSNLVKLLGDALHAIDKKLVLVIPAHHRVFDDTPFSAQDLRRLQAHVDYYSLNAYDHATAIGEESGNAPMPWLRYILNELLSVSEDVIDEDDPFNDDLFKGEEPMEEARNIDTDLAAKVLLGLNLYGYTFTTDGVMNTITANEYRDLVQFSTMSIPLTIEWNEEQGEHRMHGKFWSIWYPTPLSILLRVQLAREYGIGISVWEAGQGVEYLWDVLL